MANTAVTASRVISFAEALESRSEAFYRDLAERFPDARDRLRSYADDCQKNRVSLVRTYRETVSDALETGFSFRGLDVEDYEIETTLDEEATFEGALRQAVEVEEKAAAFHRTVAERSRSLLATIAMAFKSAARKRERRRRELASLLE
jgi:rubrerythrin